MEEELITFELAKKLKDAGMPQDLDADYGYIIRECYSSADYSPFYKIGEKVLLDGFSPDDFVIVPTLSLVAKWLREDKNIQIVIIPETNDFDEIISSNYIIKIWNKQNPVSLNYATYESYEDALKVAITESIELIENNERRY